MTRAADTQKVSEANELKRTVTYSSSSAQLGKILKKGGGGGVYSGERVSFYLSLFCLH